MLQSNDSQAGDLAEREIFFSMLVQNSLSFSYDVGFLTEQIRTDRAAD